MKAILVIDMPIDCPHCPMAHWNKLDTFTGCDAVFGKRYAVSDDEEYAESAGRPNWCPLKSMPKRKIVGEIEEVDDFMKSDIQIINEKVTAKIMLDTELLLASGYNLCLDDILGEQNESNISG